MEYVVFSDESYITAERYRSIAALSFPRPSYEKISSEIQSILRSSSVEEFKWQKLKTAKYRFCALKLANFICQNVYSEQIRIDVVIWDTQDSRHKIQGRDDGANFERMFFHLMKNLMRRREYNSGWYVFPDEKLEIDWITVRDCLDSVGRWRDYFDNGWFPDAFSDQFFNIKRFDQIDSKTEPCCQLADFFAGMAVFSKNNYAKYCSWNECHDQQLSFFDQPKEVKTTQREKERFETLKRFNSLCKRNRLGVSLKTRQCLCTLDPHNPINFWHYIPQHEFDKAPIRDS